jgi:hypothetical protein
MITEAALFLLSVPRLRKALACFSLAMKGDKEVGRVIEYGKNGQWETEIAEIVSKNF